MANNLILAISFGFKLNSNLNYTFHLQLLKEKLPTVGFMAFDLPPMRNSTDSKLKPGSANSAEVARSLLQNTKRERESVTHAVHQRQWLTEN